MFNPKHHQAAQEAIKNLRAKIDQMQKQEYALAEQFNQTGQVADVDFWGVDELPVMDKPLFTESTWSVPNDDYAKYVSQYTIGECTVVKTEAGWAAYKNSYVLSKDGTWIFYSAYATDEERNNTRFETAGEAIRLVLSGV